MTEKNKDALAAINALSHSRYVDRVNEAGRREFSQEEENARQRKAIKVIFDILAEAHPDITASDEYRQLTEYYNRFEEIKASVKDELNIE